MAAARLTPALILISSMSVAHRASRLSGPSTSSRRTGGCSAQERRVWLGHFECGLFAGPPGSELLGKGTVFQAPAWLL